MKKAPYLFMDIGNTSAKFCPGTLKKFGEKQSFSTHSFSEKDVLKMKKCFPDSKLILSSVVPQKTKLIQKLWPKRQLHVISHLSPLGIQIGYPEPSKIGSDRLASAVGAAHYYGCPVVVVDFGTATTFDIISKDCSYLGGVIAPGLNLMISYLHEKTALLPEIEIKEPNGAIGISTTEAMRIGAVTGYRGLVREVLAGIRKEFKIKKLKTVATGGHSKLIIKKIPEIEYRDPKLILKGIQHIAKLLEQA